MLNLGNLTLGITTNLSQVSSSFKNFASQLSTLHTNFNANAFNSALNGVAKTAQLTGLAITASLGGAIMKASQEATKEGFGMAKINTIAQLNPADTESLRKQLNQVSLNTGQNGLKTMDAGYEAISSGIQTKDLAGFMNQINNASLSGFAEQKDVVGGVTSLLNAYGQGAEKTTQILDDLMYAQNKGKITLGEMASQIGNVSSVMAQTGVSIEEYSAWLSITTSKGMTAGQAHTSLASALSNVMKPSEQAKKEAKALGLEFNTTALQAKGLKGFLEDVFAKTGGNTEALGKLFGDAEAVKGLMSVKGNLKDIDKMLDEMKKGGSLADATKVMKESQWYKQQQAIEEFRQAWASLGATLTPFITQITNMIQLLIGWLNSLTDSQRNTFAQFLIWGFVAGIVIFCIGSIISVVQTAIEIFYTLKTAVSVVMGVVKGATVAGAIASIESMLSIIGVVMAVVYAVWFLSTNWENVWNGLKMVTSGVATSIVGICAIIVDGIAKVCDSMAKLKGMAGAITLIGQTTSNPMLEALGTGLNLLDPSDFSSASEYLKGKTFELNEYSNDSKANITKEWDFNPFDNIAGMMKSGAEAITGGAKGAGSGLGDIPQVPDGGYNTPITAPNTSGGSNPALDNAIAKKQKDSEASQKAKEEAQKYQQAIDSLTSSIKNMTKGFEDKIGLFDKFTRKILNVNSLLAKAKSRADAYTEWQKVQNQLMNRSELTLDLKDKIGQMGADQLGELTALSKMSTEQMKQWVSYNAKVGEKSLQQASNSTYNTNLNVSVQDNNVKAIAEQIYKELKKKGAIA